MRTTKKFDCVAIKRQAAEVLYEQLKNMTIDEQLAYWKQGTDQLRQQQQLNQQAKA